MNAGITKVFVGRVVENRIETICNIYTPHYSRERS